MVTAIDLKHDDLSRRQIPLAVRKPPSPGPAEGTYRREICGYLPYRLRVVKVEELGDAGGEVLVQGIEEVFGGEPGLIGADEQG